MFNNDYVRDLNNPQHTEKFVWFKITNMAFVVTQIFSDFHSH